MPRTKDRCSNFHRYVRIMNQNGRPLWSCQDCPSYTYTGKALVGKKARCWACGSEFTITPRTLISAKLKCESSLEACKGKMQEEMNEMIHGVILGKQKKVTTMQDILKLYETESVKKGREEDEPISEQERNAVAAALGSSSESEQEDGVGILKELIQSVYKGEQK